MGVRNLIGHERPDGTIRYVYCHWGGEPMVNGRILRDHYADPVSVAALIDLGNLSSLGVRPAPEPGEPHSFDQPAPDVTVAYHRDRGEDLEGPRETRLRHDLLREEWAYLFVESDGEWLFRRCEDGEDWKPLTTPPPAEEHPDVRRLREQLEALTGTSLRPDGEVPIEVSVADEHREALVDALAALGLAGDVREDGPGVTVVVASGTSRDEVERRQVLAALAGARVAASGARVVVRGPRRPRTLELLGDQVVEPGSDQLDGLAHRSLLRKLEEHCPDEPHPLAPRGVTRARTRGPTTDAITPTLGEVAREERRGEVRLEVEVRFAPPAPTLTRIEHVVRDLRSGLVLGFRETDLVMDGARRMASRERSSIYVPPVVGEARSTLTVRTWQSDVRAASPEVALGDHPILGATDPVDDEGVSLVEWGLVRSEDTVEGVARYRTSRAGFFAVQLVRLSHGTRVDTEMTFLGWIAEGTTGAAHLRDRYRDRAPEDVVCVELLELTPGGTWELQATHAP
ncbi:MAG: hypothetical protein H6738_21735 [Alphaproteobacteria bacterium]|nr:hypothetical protein [Alphaproteobacteria bacterium]MCB9699419.1 hypothetical protein [Alphaproteobacteria bacterium]